MRIAHALVVLMMAATSVQATTIEAVPIGSPGNPADMRYVDSRHPNGVGSVSYTFSIGATEVTNSQYAAFLNAVAATDPYELYYTNMGTDQWGGIVRNGSVGSYTYEVQSPVEGQGPGGSDHSYGDKPVVYVSSGDAMRFANWLHNGQPTGPQDASTTEDGAYTLNGAVTDTALAAVTRNTGASWWLPNESEWYKAAYYDPAAGLYYDYPTGTNSVPNNNLPTTDTGNSANYYDDYYTTDNPQFPMTNVGSYTLSKSPYGTFDQGGNVWEWNETAFAGIGHGIRGGSNDNFSDIMIASYYDFTFASDTTYNNQGFRIARNTRPDDFGDFKHDNKVDTADYVVWRQSNGTQIGYNAWRANFGKVLSGTGVAYSTVPEPSSALLAVGIFALLTTRRRRS